MNWTAIKFYIVMIVIYILPFLILRYASGAVQAIMSKSHRSIKLIDILVIYFFMGIHIFSEEITGQSFIPYILIGLSVIGIILASLFKFYNSTFPFYYFFKIYWRLLDLILLFTYTITGLAFFILYFFN